MNGGVPAKRHGGVIDRDVQEAAFAVMRVEYGALLRAMHHIDGIVDVRRCLARRAGVASIPKACRCTPQLASAVRYPTTWEKGHYHL